MKMPDRAVPLCALLLCLVLFACSGGPAAEADLVGMYAAPPESNGPHVELTLKEQGEGDWVVDGETSRFTWEVREGELWLHTKTGGVLAGEIKGDAVTLTLPGIGRLTLLRHGR